MTEASPRISIIVPAYNAAESIGNLLAALRQQEGAPAVAEVIVVDDGSTDNTVIVAAGFPEVKVITQDHAGPAAARNRGAREATGDILVFVDADCEPAPTWLAALTRPFLNDKDVVATKGVYRTRQTSWAARFAQLEFESRYLKLARQKRIAFVDTYSAAVRADAFRDVGGFDPHFPVADHEDADFSFKLARRGSKMVFCPDAVVYHRHSASWRRYLALKFRRAFWRALVYRRFPARILKDTYTPELVKFQVFCVGVLSLAAAATLWVYPAWRVTAGAAATLLITTVPLTALALRRDPGIALVVPAAVIARAVVYAFGGAAGLLSRRRYDLLFPTVYFLTDCLTVAFGTFVSYWLRAHVVTVFLPPIWHPFVLYGRAAIVVAAIWVATFAFTGLYRTVRAAGFMTEATKTVRALAIVAAMCMVGSYLTKYEFSRAVLALFFLITVPVALATRFAIWAVKDALHRRGYNQTRAVIVGTTEAAKAIGRQMTERPALGYRLVGFVADHNQPDLPGGGYLGPPARLCDIVNEHYVDEVIVADAAYAGDKMLELVGACEGTGVAFRAIYSAVGALAGQVEFRSLGDVPLVNFLDAPFQPVKRFVKRLGDVCFAIFTAPVWLPVLLVAAAIQLAVTKQFPFVRIETAGRGGFVFERWEVRTDVGGTWGRLLATSRLYRLPWFVNVLLGDMSVVGPRPYDYDLARTLTGWRSYRFRVKPGLTGLWLVMVREGAPVSSELEFDFYYVKNQTVLLDIAIIIRTLLILIFTPPWRRGAAVPKRP